VKNPTRTSKSEKTFKLAAFFMCLFLPWPDLARPSSGKNGLACRLH
jgi:hypothetical protein